MSFVCEIPNFGRDAHGFPNPALDLKPDDARATAVVAGGCFWCTEAVYRQIDGVLSVEPGYAGGSAASANYDAVCTGTTGHAEAIRIVYDTTKTSYGELLKFFFAVAHDPTQLNRQGADRGTQYRSAIFFASDDERRVAAAYIAQLDAAKIFASPIVTTLEPLETFYPAETYHQDYAARNPNQPYIAAVSTPKVEKLRSYYPDRLKD
ncbi:peptide-methionine (S)-S-oxide reductase MsrA [Chiayiivirga flava]|uniref:Peptide methionine sulfoxide reductase MsrA n=1 Tax=Chiayiivirga flava TaxID=659595 RepID=A0A7W8G352_9GAMM|nr:peptide-methionine (S)-S-oxide reductase MsrA [Chiayiivirga flava]MBB5209390.1 peptide-methionine (S)-S-oxide reductase [Chiayiivirga flava]